MSYTVIKTIGGRQYKYLQTSYRFGGKVRTKSIYLGPVGGVKRKKGGGFPPVNPAGVVLGAVKLGLYIAKNGTKSPRYSNKTHESGRTKSARDAKMRDLYKAYGIDTSSAPAFHATSSLLSAEQRVELMHRQAELGRGSKSPAAQSDEMKAFADRIAEHKADQDARIAAQEAAPRTEAPAAKNFTVDDEIEAREAKFEATVEEYNAGTQAAAAEPAPADAPTPDATGTQTK